MDPRTQRFCELYVMYGTNVSKCARLAGFGKTNAASYLLKIPKNIEYIEKRRKELLKTVELNQLRTLREIMRIGFVDVRDLFHLEGDNKGKLKQIWELDDNTAAAVESIQIDKNNIVKIKMYDKLSALEKIGKFQNLWNSDMNLNLNFESGVVAMPSKLPVGAPVDLNRVLPIPGHIEIEGGEENGE